MNAALIRELGALPEVGQVDEPTGDDVVEVVAAPINPIDVNTGKGLHPAGHAPLPYVPGYEGIVRSRDGRVRYLFSDGLGQTPAGAMAERCRRARWG